MPVYFKYINIAICSLMGITFQSTWKTFCCGVVELTGVGFILSFVTFIFLISPSPETHHDTALVPFWWGKRYFSDSNYSKILSSNT